MPELIGDALRWHATYTPHKPAVVAPDGKQTYGELWRRVVRLADALSSLGVTRGDRLAAMLNNGAPYVELYYAAALLSAAVVPLNTRFVASEVEYVIDHSGASMVVFDAAFAAMIAVCRPSLSPRMRFVAVGSPVTGNAIAYEELIGSSSAKSWFAKSDPDACFFQGYTSGTTGFPKGCVNPHRRFADCLKRMRLVYGIGPDDTQIVPAPLFHEAPALFALTQLFAGGTVVVTPDPRPASVFALIETHRVTWAFMVPTMWSTMIASDDVAVFDVSTLSIVVSGGSPLHSQTKAAMLERFPRAALNEFYGATEVGLITNLGPDDQRRKVRSVGRPVPGMFVEVRDEDGAPVPTGEVGEIHIGGSILIEAYFRNPEATAAARGADGFFTLGDMGRFDDEGYLYIVDRKKDMIISGGENIFPNDIEDVLYQHPGVQMAAVVGAPDDRWGERVVAVVVAKPGYDLDEQALVAHCRASLAAFKVPKSIEFRDALPLSAFGKILRREIRQPFWAGHEALV